MIGIIWRSCISVSLVLCLGSFPYKDGSVSPHSLSAFPSLPKYKSSLIPTLVLPSICQEELSPLAMASAPTPPGMSGPVFSLCVSFSALCVILLTVISASQTLFAAFGGILFGYDTGVISGIQTMQIWLCRMGKFDPSTGLCSITSSQQSLVVSILSAGTFFGALFAAPTGDFLGRRWSVVLGVLTFAVGVAMQAASKHLPLFVVGRVFAGWGVGMVSMLIPMYQSECSPKWIRSVSLPPHHHSSRLA